MRQRKGQNTSGPWIQRLDRLLEKVLPGLLPEERRYVALVPCVGVLSGFLAMGLEYLLDLVQWVCWSAEPKGKTVYEAAKELASTQPGLVIGIPVMGGLLVTLGLLVLGKRERVSGTAGLMQSLAFRRGRIPLLSTLLEGVISITAVGTGASLGREGALIHSGAAAGSWLGCRLGVADHHVRILLACGAAGGMAAAYKAPIGAAVFAMEILLGSFAIELFGPIIVCAVIARTITQDFFGTEAVYVLTNSLPSVGGWEIVTGLVLGAFLGVVSVVFVRVFNGLHVFFRLLRPVHAIRPVLAMTVLGVVGIFVPEMFGNGYATVNRILEKPQEYTIQFLLLLPVLKIVMTALCRTGGIPGGLFTPSLFVGAPLGCAAGLLLASVFPSGWVSTPTVYALVGMGAIVAGTLQAPITAILMIFELTQDYGLILPLTSACIASALVSHMLRTGSLYTEGLRRRGIFFPTASTPVWIRQPEVRSVITPRVATIGPSERFKNLTEKFLRAPEGQDHLYVVDSEDHCLGVISLHDIKRFIQEAENLDSVIAVDVMSSSFPCVFADDPISKAIEILGAHSFERLPVLEDSETRRLLGTVSKRKLLRVYRMSRLARQGNGSPDDSGHPALEE